MTDTLDTLVSLLSLERIEENLFRGASQDLGFPQLDRIAHQAGKELGKRAGQIERVEGGAACVLARQEFLPDALALLAGLGHIFREFSGIVGNFGRGSGTFAGSGHKLTVSWF